MKRFYSIIIIVLLAFGCRNSVENKTAINNEPPEVKTVEVETDSLSFTEEESITGQVIIERYFPKEKESVEFDTTITSKKISIRIISRHLDSFVVDEFETEDAKYIDKYRDSEKQVIITKSNRTIIDTVIRKGDFIALTGPDLLKIADFHNYWFRELRNDTIEFFGVINKPETDWGTPFYHYFDLKSETFTAKQYFEEDI